jgi:hypothetical protein
MFLFGSTFLTHAQAIKTIKNLWLTKQRQQQQVETVSKPPVQNNN